MTAGLNELPATSQWGKETDRKEMGNVWFTVDDYLVHVHFFVKKVEEVFEETVDNKSFVTFAK